jgi:DNA-binding NtrC family response regulator
MKLGAYDFLTKPIRIAELTATIEKAREKKNLLRENELLRREVHRKAGEGHIITGSPLMRALLDDVSRVAGSDFPVLISGETGVGKELVAREVHRRSGRSEKPFIPINCGALPETMLESELFGFEKGAFTGAHGRKAGLLEVAEGGSLFLDEIGEMTPALQGKLLRAVENGSFFRLGGTREMKVDVRFVAATNRDLEKAVDDGTFRMDLYYRINALPLNVPPLRERREDIPLLAQHFTESTPAFRGRKIAPEAIARLREYSWPGNVRELQNIVHRLLLLAEGDTVTEEDIAGMLSPRPSSRGRQLKDVERDHILRVLADAGGHRRRAAEILGVDPKTLYRKMKEYDD